MFTAHQRPVHARGRAPPEPRDVAFSVPIHLPPATSLLLARAQHAGTAYPHAVALEDIMSVQRRGVQRVYRRWVLHRAGERGRAGTQTLGDLFRRSKEAQGTRTRQEGGQLAAANMSTKK